MQNVILNTNDTVNSTNLYGTVGVTAVQILAAAVNRKILLQLHNPSNSSFLACTLDGTTPVVNGAGYTVAPLATFVLDTVVPQGPLTLIASGASSPYTITYM